MGAAFWIVSVGLYTILVKVVGVLIFFFLLKDLPEDAELPTVVGYIPFVLSTLIIGVAAAVGGLLLRRGTDEVKAGLTLGATMLVYHIGTTILRPDFAADDLPYLALFSAVFLAASCLGGSVAKVVRR